VPPPIPQQPELVVCLPDRLSIALFIQLGRVVRNIDRSMPDVEHDTQVAFQAYADDAVRLLAGLPRLYVFERRGLEQDPGLRALATQLEARPSPAPAAVTTTKAGLFNYLHPDLIRQHLGVPVEVDDRTDVPLATAQAMLTREDGSDWSSLVLEEQDRRIEEAKRLLVTQVATAMTPELLTARKGTANVTRWLYAIKLNLPRQFYD